MAGRLVKLKGSLTIKQTPGPEEENWSYYFARNPCFLNCHRFKSTGNVLCSHNKLKRWLLFFVPLIVCLSPTYMYLLFSSSWDKMGLSSTSTPIKNIESERSKAGAKGRERHHPEMLEPFPSRDLSPCSSSGGRD